MATQSFDPDAKYAQLGERVDNQVSRITNLETVVSRGFDAVASRSGGYPTIFAAARKPSGRSSSDSVQ